MIDRREIVSSAAHKLYAEFLFFDLDGTLVDSGEAIAESWDKLSDKFGIDKLKLTTALGGTSIDTIRKLFDERSVPEAVEAFHAFELQTASSVKEVRGARSLLESIPSKAWGLVTSSDRSVAIARMKSAKLPIPSLIISSDDYSQGKPSPNPYLVALQRANHPASECICFENSIVGITSARSCGLRVIGITTDISHSEPGTLFTIRDWRYLQIYLLQRGVLEVSHLATL